MGIPKEHVQATRQWEVNQNRSPPRSIFNAPGEWKGERRLQLVRAGHTAGTGLWTLSALNSHGQTTIPFDRGGN